MRCGLTKCGVTKCCATKCGVTKCCVTKCCVIQLGTVLAPHGRRVVLSNGTRWRDVATMGGVSSSDDLSCPGCRESDDLRGRRDGDLITVDCQACGTSWQRDPERRCPRCGAGDLYEAPVAIVEKSRGTQLSIMSTRAEFLCWACDRDLIDDQRQSGTALMPDQLPTI